MPLYVCPKCHIEMKQVKRRGAKFDICSHCKGVWFDDGELERLLEYSRNYYKNAKLMRKRNKFFVNIFELFR